MEEEMISVLFSPDGGCTDRIVQAIDRAAKSIDMLCYTFTSVAISDALIRAHQRGLLIKVVWDYTGSHGPGSVAKDLVDAGIPVVCDKLHKIAHNKVILIDGMTIFTGSFNFTVNAQHNNAENSLQIDGMPILYDGYDKDFQLHLSHSVPYEPVMPPHIAWPEMELFQV